MYKVNGEVKKIDEVLAMIEENIGEEEYDEMIDDCYPEVVFGTLSYLPSQVLQAVDPIAYRCGFLEYVDSELYGNIEYELERMSDGEELEFYGVTVEFTDEEDEEDEEEEEEISEEELNRIKERLEYLRSQIESECISFGEIIELSELTEYIEKDDVLLLQWAGIKEEEDSPKC